MNILPITRNINENINKYSKNKDNKTYNINNRNYQIPFRAVSNESLNLVQQIPLDDRLASMFEKFLHGDLILVGKKINKAKQKMLECTSLLDCAVKRIFFIPDNKLNGYLGFSKNREGLKEVINLNNFDIQLLDYSKDEFKIENLTPKDSYFIFDGDSISIQDYEINIKSKPKHDLNGFRKNFCQAKSFEKDIAYELEKLNRKSISQLSKEAKQTSSKITFKDVGGQDELIAELKKSILYPLKYPEVYETFDVNKGFVLYGPPGTGKTHIARALANEAGVNFVSLNGLELESKWVGESEENWRNLFEEAKQKQPTIIFIDEIDAIGKSRGGKDAYGDKVVNQVLTLLTDIDNNKDNVIVIGATNNFKALDKALIRPGRLSKHLEAKKPDKNGVSQIFKIYSAKKPLDRNLNQEIIEQKLYNIDATGADIRYVVNEAHSAALERCGINKKMEEGTFSSKDLCNLWITQEDFNNAIQKFLETRNGTEARPIGFNK